MIHACMQGLIIGTRMYYRFHGSELDDEAVFEERMDALVRELGDRGLAKAQLPEAVPPAPAPASALPPSPRQQQSRTPAK